ncbi:hypothetical protein M409DRAFT_63349 [Zasmidium cellare ATCC 36951]|uniref:Alpha/beta hydrolase fold-3 domain-containing protein n=1 Tax=Zasmidium cellare ATCC 36951 TaxID=1080233 RepID=A0A6A6CXB1_ZASCE|nr:uncharacterized protein M409DRAFT_63349 [Zasmidium cellare ATCC 36951]KAF2171751.1 hypothetical protein M409DRAFT_63349 [Zasmidium cellare ATCC 36951]
MAEEQDEKDVAVSEESLKVPAKDGYENELRVFRSAKASTPGPLIVLYHGGGCILGSPTMVADVARWLVKKYNAVVAAPAYRLAPEHVFPTSGNDAWDTFSWVAKNATTTLRSDPSKGFIIGGVSAGATMSIIIAHLARDNKVEPKITGVYSACGSIRPRDINDMEPKYRERYLSRDQKECIYNPVLSKEMSDFMAACYQADTKSKLYAPLMWPDGEGHKGFPRIYQQVCGRDPGRDEVFIFEDILKGLGVETKTDLYLGLPHCFWIGLKSLPEGKRWERDTVDGIGWLLRP